MLTQSPSPQVKICRHCLTGPATRPRRLCWQCYYAPGVRQLYPSTSRFARRGVGNGHHQTSLPTSPTSALPGSPEKVIVLEQRALARQALWHPGDADPLL